MAIAGTSLYVGGSFQNYRGVANSANGIAKLDLTSGAIDTTFSPPAANGFDSRVDVLAVIGSELYVFGPYYNWYRNSQRAESLIRLDLDSGYLLDHAP